MFNIFNNVNENYRRFKISINSAPFVEVTLTQGLYDIDSFIVEL